MTKVFLFGIDGAFPEYFFGEWLDELPNIKRLMHEGAYAKLNSTIPPLSVTAWTSILTGKNPAEHGLFEYTYRNNFDPEDIRVVTSRNLKEKTIWDILSEKNKKSIITYVLLTWPIKPFNGIMITGPLTPLVENVEFVYPAELKKEIENALGEMPLPDVPNFRDLSKQEIVKEIRKLTEKQLDCIDYLVKNKEWDFFLAMVPLSDRMNHSFWRYMDKEHRKYEEGSEFKDALKEYYKAVDNRLGRLIEMLKEMKEDIAIIVMSDHGITRMHTRVNLTDWLLKKGYLALKEPLTEKKEFKLDMVDWSKTRAFAIGAYEGQIFVNLKGREPLGIVEESEYDSLVDELEKELMEIRGDDGKILDTKVFKKKDFFKGKREKIAPDIVIYFDGLHYGCNTTLIGNETQYSLATAKGSDDACHSEQGIFILNDGRAKGDMGEIWAIDVAPTILDLLGENIPEDMKGKIIGKNLNLEEK